MSRKYSGLRRQPPEMGACDRIRILSLPILPVNVRTYNHQDDGFTKRGLSAFRWQETPKDEKDRVVGTRQVVRGDRNA
ncbi:hypothetical protein KQX54_021396 [Cotesia glomerata]|uniref:Uncharacterized protein n=1 Tax=Cotesia glomerata TaxID=32391 RepID=A0AAV7J8P1_COTGL|nr:hypothetical protein KQX54_021396 [Cotesia glomerata]